MLRVFIVVPSLQPTGPIKGAVALSNSLVTECCVTLIVLKPPSKFPGYLDPRVKQIMLGGVGHVLKYLRVLREASARGSVISLSFCFSADVINFLVRHHVRTASTVRGHLRRTYRIDYGFFGELLARVHYFLIARLDRVIAMTSHMANEIEVITGRSAYVIGNFIDEHQLEFLRSRKPSKGQDSLNQSELRYAFIGRLDPLKMPHLVIDAISFMISEGVECSLDIFGDGPLSDSLSAYVSKCGIRDHVRFHGHVSDPWLTAIEADCLVLPSLTEGVSRAAMEALYLGIPCVMRAVDSNADLIEHGKNGILFYDDSSLVSAMKQGASLGRSFSSHRPVLLGQHFRRATCVNKFQELFRNL